MFFGKQKFDVKQLKLNKFIFDVKQLQINKLTFDVKQLKMNRFIKSISDLIIRPSNATLEVLSLRPFAKCDSMKLELQRVELISVKCFYNSSSTECWEKFKEIINIFFSKGVSL